MTEVVRRPRRAEPLPPGKIKETIKTPARKAKPPRVKPLALVVKNMNEEFPELLKTVSTRVDPTITGNSISRIRKTRTGDLLIVINGGEEEAEVVRAEVTKSLGDGAKVQRISNESPIEIRDLDGEVTREKVPEDGVRGNAGARLASLRKAYRGSQTAVV